MGVCTKERKGITAEVLMATPCTKTPVRGSHTVTHTREGAGLFFFFSSCRRFFHFFPPPSSRQIDFNWDATVSSRRGAGQQGTERVSDRARGCSTRERAPCRELCARPKLSARMNLLDSCPSACHAGRTFLIVSSKCGKVWKQPARGAERCRHDSAPGGLGGLGGVRNGGDHQGCLAHGHAAAEKGGPRRL